MNDRTLDIQVAERIFGYTIDYEFADLHAGAPCVKELRDQYDEWGMLPCYASDMADAWLVVEAMRARGFWFDVGDTVEGSLESIRAAGGKLNDQPRIWAAYFGRKVVVRAATAPEAICRAALKVVDEAVQP